MSPSTEVERFRVIYSKTIRKYVQVQVTNITEEYEEEYNDESYSTVAVLFGNITVKINNVFFFERLSMNLRESIYISNEYNIQKEKFTEVITPIIYKSDYALMLAVDTEHSFIDTMFSEFFRHVNNLVRNIRDDYYEQ